MSDTYSSVKSTVDDVKSYLIELRDSKTWNWILMGTALLTLVVAARNISIYASQISDIRESTGVTLPEENKK